MGGKTPTYLKLNNMEFPNGFDSWYETHHEIVEEITLQLNNVVVDEESVVGKRQSEQGQGGIYELAKELTDKFEKEYEGVIWGVDKEYYDEMEEFKNREL